VQNGVPRKEVLPSHKKICLGQALIERSEARDSLGCFGVWPKHNYFNSF